MKRKNLRYFIQYDDNDNVVPMSLVKMTGWPRMSGQWKEVYKVCCDPAFEKFENYSTKQRAFLILNKAGEPMSGPLVRSHAPSGVFTMQVPYNICCDVPYTPPTPPTPENFMFFGISDGGVPITSGTLNYFNINSTEGTNVTALANLQLAEQEYPYNMGNYPSFYVPDEGDTYEGTFNLSEDFDYVITLTIDGVTETIDSGSALADEEKSFGYAVPAGQGRDEDHPVYFTIILQNTLPG